MRRWRTFKKLWAGGLLALVMGGQLFLTMPEQAFAGIPVAVDADVPFTGWVASQEIKDGTKQSLIAGIFTGIVNLLTFAANRLAYDAAVMLASGGAADSPLVEYRTVDDYLKDYSSAVAGEAVGLLSDELAEAGGVLSSFDLCSPSSPEVLLKLRMGIRSIYDRPEPRCNWNEVKGNWEGFIAEMSTDLEGGAFRNEVILSQLAESLDPSTNEFAVGIAIYTDILGKTSQDGQLATAKLIAQGPIKDVTDAITGRVETPASMINYEYMQTTANSKELPQQIAYATLSNTDALLQIGLSAGSVFANTLLSQLTNKLYTGLFDFDAIEDTNPFDEGMFASSNRDDAQRRFKSLLSIAPLEVTNYSLLSEFSACPTQSRGLYNCVADSTFISAVARAETGAAVTLEEAIEDDLVDRNWALIPSSDSARDQDPYCYTYGFCHSNLVKLRKARIIPIGWELAAESMANSADDPVTLGEVMDGFDDCNASGERDDNHPWCKLVDPNWVLKYPDTQCKALVYGQLLETSATDKRKQECVDMPSCIAEDENGNCIGGYGYCVREENTWEFRGDSCPEYAASCLSLTDTDGDDENFIMNTVDYGNCSEDNAGCEWYWTTQEDGAWPTLDDVAAADAAADTHEERVYFTAAVETCSPEDGGCTELIERDNDTRLNAVQNSGFEHDEDENDIPDAWTLAAGASWDASDTLSRTGSGAIAPAAGAVTQEGIVLAQGTFYTLSFYARQASEGAAEKGAAFLTLSADGSTESVDLVGTAYSDGCTVDSSAPDIIIVDDVPDADGSYSRVECTFTTPVLSSDTADLVAEIDLAGNVIIDDVQLEQGEDSSDYHDGYGDAKLAYQYVKVAPEYLGCDGSADDPEACADYAAVCAETEVGCMAYAPSNDDPTVFGITSNLDECPSACVGYDTYMQEATLFEPEGDFPVYFIADTAEECSEEDVGCDEFTRLSDESLVYFSYVRACVTPEEADANGIDDGEATFYTWEGSDLTGYQLVTWSLLESDLDSVSSDDYNNSGLTETSPGQAPCTSWTATANGIECNDDAADANAHFDTDSDTCDEHDDIFRNPNCREFYDTDGNIHYRDWSLTVTVNNACESYRKTELVGLGDDDDADGLDDGQENCTASGGYFDTSLNACIYYGYEEESQECSESANGCRMYTGGSSRNSRLVMEETFEDGDLTNWESASASTVTYSNESVATDGHSLASAGENVWTYLYDNGGTCNDAAGCASSGSTLGGTCTVIEGEEYCGTLVNELYPGKTYTVSFWAKGTGNVEVGFDMDAAASAGMLGPGDPTFGSVALSSSAWEEYRLGPLNITEEEYADFGNDTVLVFEPDSGVTFYVDNIVIREGEENITLIKDSWVTPDACDETPQGVASPQYYLGCQEYTTQEGDTENLKSFSSLCSEEVVGCEDFYATQQSESPYAQVYSATCSRLTSDTGRAVDCYAEASGTEFDQSSQFLCTIGVGQASCQFDQDWYTPSVELPSHLAYGPETEVVPADAVRFLVVTPDVECDSSAAGCTEYGSPVFSADRQSVAESESVWLMNLPDEYADILCSHSELFCEAWESDDDGTFYFKDPVDQTCEYRTDVTVNGATYDGWFRKDTNEFCYGTCSVGRNACSSDADCTASSSDSCDTSAGSYLVGGDQSGIWMNGDDNYGGWVGSCDAEYNGCSEFIDVLDVASDAMYGQADGEAYHYLDNDSLEENSLPSSQRCDGQVSQKEGCSLFRDTSESAVLWSATATFMASAHADALFGDKPYSLVDPIDCESGDSTITMPNGTEIDLCENRCRYYNAELNDLSGGSGYVYGTSCYESNDCASFESEAGDVVEGTCVSGADRLENDVNRVVKVNRDRQCSEWLSCANATTVWDERTNSYKTVCDDIALCDEYSSDGNSSFCSSWQEDSTAAIIDIDRYAARDVSWYGDEYSGMAIPDLFPVELLTQEMVSPPAGYCDMRNATYTTDGSAFAWETSTLHGSECEVDSDCDGMGVLTGENCVTEDELEYDLVYNAGSCEEEYGESCTVGYCENTGEACSATADCSAGAGSCVTGVCYEQLGECSDDTQCSVGSCISGVCSVNRGNLDISRNGSCSLILPIHGGDVVYNDSVSTKVGTCVRGSCLLTPEGDAYAVDNTTGQICRGYPESNSPFPNEVVQQWQYSPNGDTVDWTLTDDIEQIHSFATGGWGAHAYETVSGFENVNLCGPGEDCSCSYAKLMYGDAGEVRYLAPDSDLNTNAIGVCQGGVFDGAYCSNDGSANSTTNAMLESEVIGETTCEGNFDSADESETYGTCVYPTRQDNLLGLEGYCLERDTAINIHGNRDDDHRACVTWLPVDQLAGSTDLYAKYLTAGFATEGHLCADVRLYYNVSSIFGCAEIRGEDGKTGGGTDAEEGNNSWCSQTMECPSGFFAVGGSAEVDKDGDPSHQYGSICTQENNACPYMCVPMNSVHADGSTCVAPDEESDAAISDISIRETSSVDYDDPDFPMVNGNTVYYTDDLEEVDTLLGYYQDCTYYGASVTDDDSEMGVLEFPNDAALTGETGDDVTFYLEDEDTTDGLDINDSVYYHFAKTEVYPACADVIEASDGSSDEYNFAWTDRVANANSEFTLDAGNLTYSYSTPTAAFGMSLSPAQALAGYDSNGDPVPAVVPGCSSKATLISTISPADSAEDPTDCIGDYEPTFAADDAPQAREFIAWDSTLVNDSDGGIETSEGASSIVNRLKQLFAKPLGYYEWSNDDKSLSIGGAVRGSYGERLSTSGTSWEWDVRAEEGVPPTVWALDLGTCEGTECEEGPENELTLNNANSGTQEGSDFFRAYLKFYAAAYKEQLPIRRIIVDWGDDSQPSGSETADNFYKNHRGLQSDSNVSICDTDDGEWGMTDASCDPNYLSYNHIYTCEGRDVEGAAALPACTYDENGEIINSPCTANGACYFRPKVHIVDNWGWCTGVCEGGDDGDSGCFEGDGTPHLQTSSGYSGGAYECNYPYLPNSSNADDPWVYYSGAVAVTP